MNIDVRTVDQWASAVSTQCTPGPSGTDVPGGTVRSTSPGMRPSWQTERASGSSAPRPWTSSQTIAFTAMMPSVTTGVSSVGFSSL